MSPEGSIKNRDTFPVGTRVVPYAKRRLRAGTVRETREDGRVCVHWDGDMIPGDPPIGRIQGPFLPFELRAE